MHTVYRFIALLKVDFVTVRNASCGKVMFSQACVSRILATRGVHGKGGACVARGSCGAKGACVAKGGNACMAGEGECMAGRRPLQRTVSILLESILVVTFF